MIIFQKSVKKIQVFIKNLTIMVTLHEDLCTCMRICCQILLRMRNISDKSCIENEDTHFMVILIMR